MTNAIRPPALGRRAVLAAGAALPLFSIRTRPANAADFTYKLATGQDPTHPVNKRAQEAIDRIREATGGRLEIRLFPANQLGSDTDLLGRCVTAASSSSTKRRRSWRRSCRRPASSTSASRSRPTTRSGRRWTAALGTYIQSQIEKVGLHDRLADLGQRLPPDHVIHASRSTPPTTCKASRSACLPRRSSRRCSQALGAGPTPINFNELYSALQTKLVEGQENPLPIIYTAKLYEVQQNCSLTNHVWDGYWILANRRAMLRLPQDIQDIVRPGIHALGQAGAGGHCPA